MKHLLSSTVAVLAIASPLAAASLASCSSHDPGGPADATPRTDRVDPPPPAGSFCALPGSVIWSAQGVSVVPGGPDGPDLTWLALPEGFCAHYFGNVPDVRQLRFAPGGELFAASPTTPTTGGNYTAGMASILVLPDDNRDGVADANTLFLGNLASTQGLMFANGSFYFQDAAAIRRLPYRAGDRKPSGAPQTVTTITAPQDALHWPKVMDVGKDGTIYITNGGSQGDQCTAGNPTRGSIFALQADGSTALVAKGFRNPIALRCETDHDVCLAAELALDYSGDKGGREKVVPVHAGDDWGYPCCATQNLPYAGVTDNTGAVPDCSGVAPESNSFVIGHTPFGLDFENGKWPAPWGGRVFVTLHGVAGTWEGARLVAIARDPATGMPMPATELNGGGPAADAMLDFATGWDDGMRDHGRPAPITFAADGRMFLGNDHNGDIVWIAPVSLIQH